MVGAFIAGISSMAVDVVDRQRHFVLRLQEQGVARSTEGNILLGVGDTERNLGRMIGFKQNSNPRSRRMILLLKINLRASIKALVSAVLLVEAMAPSQTG